MLRDKRRIAGMWKDRVEVRLPADRGQVGADFSVAAWLTQPAGDPARASG